VDTPAAVEPRSSARVLLLDRDDRVLLFRGIDPGAASDDSWWFTPGGGLDPGESHRDGAARELFEETGLRCDPADLIGPVHEEETLFDFARRRLLQHSTFFVLRVDSHVVDVSGFEEVEASSIVEHRWWSRDELRATGETFYPGCLVDLLDRL
jgi:8-oxo-dGTP pyrophosphatase MutT (NUDIX family)